MPLIYSANATPDCKQLIAVSSKVDDKSDMNDQRGYMPWFDTYDLKYM